MQMLQTFIGNPEIQPLTAAHAYDLLKFIRFADDSIPAQMDEKDETALALKRFKGTGDPYQMGL